MLLRQSLIFCLLVLSAGMLHAQHFHDYVHKNVTYYSSGETGDFHSRGWLLRAITG